MADNASRDQNYVPTLIATSSVDGISVVKLYADPVTHRLLVDNANTGGITSISIASANGFSGASSGGTTPILTLSTTISGILSGNGTAISGVTIGSGLSFTGGTLSATGTGSPGGLNTQLQYNNSGAFGGITGATTDGTLVSLNAPHLLNPTINGAGTGLATLTYPNTSTSVSIALPATTGTIALTSQLTSGTVTSVTSADANATVATQTTTPVITIVSAPKWATARNLAGNSVDGSATVAFANKFIVQGTADAGLSGAQFLGALSTGIVKNTTTTGVLSIATAGTDYLTVLTGAITSSGNATSLGSFTSLQLATALTDETGTGAAVFGTSPTLVSPALGTPTALVGTNISGTATNLTSGITNALASATTTVNVSSATAPTSGQVLTATSTTAATWQTLSSTPIASCLISTIFETSARFTLNVSGGTNTFGSSGLNISSSATGGNWAQTQLIYPTSVGFNEFNNNPTATFNYILNGGTMTNNQTFMVIGGSQFANGSSTTGKHIGFRIDYSVGTGTLKGTQADGTTENQTAALLTGLTTGDVLDLKVVVISGTSATYYYSKNGGAYSSAALTSTNLPTGNAANNVILNFANGSAAGTSSVNGYWTSATYQR